MIRSKYEEEEGGWWYGEVRDEYEVRLWKFIMKEQNTLLGCISFVVGNGKMVKFWMNKWSGVEPSCVSFPSLYTLVVSKDVWVQLGERGYRNPCFSHPLND